MLRARSLAPLVKARGFGNDAFEKGRTIPNRVVQVAPSKGSPSPCCPTRPSRRMPLQRTIRLQQAVRDRQLSDCRFCLANPDLTTRYAYLAPDVPEGYGPVPICPFQGSRAGNLPNFFLSANNFGA